MSAQDRPPSVGELVVRNGKKAGTVVPLSLPVTVIGRSAVCDVRLAATGVADFHCLITVTPAGPVLRSWKPEITRLNDKPTAASLLQHGDELKVGPCVFEFHWAGAPADADPTAKPALPPDLLAQVVQARELFRLERDRETAEAAERSAELDRRSERVQKLREQAKAERTKSRLVYRRFLKRMKTKWSAERKRVEAERGQLSRDQIARTSQVERVEKDRERLTSQLDDYKQRLYAAWELLAENQRRLLADRQQAEEWLARQTDLLDRRSRELDDQQRKLVDNRATLETRVGSLVTEIAGLEARAMNTRAILRQLEDKRAISDTLAGTLAVSGTHPSLVALDTPTFPTGNVHEADRLLADLHESNQAVARERAKLAVQRAELDRHTEDLTDQRAILVEQVAALAAARDHWQSNEHTTVVELEGLARAVRSRELAVDDRERELLDAERERRKREYDLWQLRVRLEGWQAALAAHEATAAADRDRADAELDAKRELCTRWQSSLEGVQQAWSTLRDQERAHFLNECAYWSEARERYTTAATEADRARTTFLAEIEKLAARAMAIEEANGADARRVRVLRKQWEKHFARQRKALDARKATVTADQTRTDDRLRELRSLATEVFDRQTTHSTDRLHTDREALVASLVVEERSHALSLETARRERGERELAELRAEIDRLSRLLSEPAPPLDDEEPDVIPLKLRAA